MAEAMKGVTKAMKTMNKQINLPQIQKIMVGVLLISDGL
jgi:charged multivesicular body protein 2A